MKKFLSKLRPPWPWYISSVVSSASFFAVTASMLIILAWRLETEGEDGFQGYVATEFSLFLGFVISSLQVFLLSKDKKILSLIFTWFLITATMAAILFLLLT